MLGKTNLDQFATGLVGVRTPYGIGRNLFDQKLIPGGSSAGSALAVGAGLAPLALGTDTAGSGRVPAAFSNIVGLKPSCGLVSTAGVVPACRTLDCVSVLALTVDDAMAMLRVIAGPDPADPFSRPRPVHAVGPMPAGLKLGVPLPGQRLFFGDRASEAAYDAALARLSGTRRKNRGDRRRAVLRDGAFALRGAMGRRALSHGARADRLLAGIAASGHAAGDPLRRARHGRRCLRSLLSARGIAAGARSNVPLDRCHGAADGADDLCDR